MSDLSTSSSFIPKRNATDHIRRPRRKNFFVLGFIASALFIAAPVASAGVFVYQQYINRELNNTITALDEATKKFDQAKMDEVIDIDARLKIAGSLLDSHISLVRALDILEAETAQSVSFDSIEVKRETDTTLVITGPVKATDFDATMYQRGVYTDALSISSSTLSDISFVPASDDDSVKAGDEITDVTFTATFTLESDDITYSPVVTVVDEIVTPDEPASDSSDSDNEPTI